MDTMITLVGIAQRYQDANGVWKKTKGQRDVFAKVESATRAEFFGGGRNGLNPEFVFTVFHGDYQGEETIIYAGRAYGVYRTFIDGGDYIELYAERKGGTNGEGDGG